jgi:hypothetical protein
MGREVFLSVESMSYKEQMQEWLKKHPNATVEEAWVAGYNTCTDNWCHGKVALFEKCRELLKQIIE